MEEIKNEIAYQNQMGLLTFKKEDAIKGKGCCGGEKYLGAPIFPPVQQVIENYSFEEIRKKKVKILYNPSSGSGYCKKIFKQISDAFK
jgi:hypothetical protein